jgi:hypothetical protein
MLDTGYVPAFFNVNEDGELYGQAWATLEPALSVLREFPNDMIIIRLVTPACLQWLTDTGYTLDQALANGMSDIEYGQVTDRSFDPC